MSRILSGKVIAERIRTRIRSEIVSNYAKMNFVPTLSITQIGKDFDATSYSNRIKSVADSVGISTNLFKLPEETTTDQLHEHINTLNDNKDIHGILLQLPLGKHICSNTIKDAISPRKDVDCVTPFNQASLLRKSNEAFFQPCTPSAVMELLKSDPEIVLDGKCAAVLGRSDIVGLPTALMLVKENATVTICHTKTKNLKSILQQADIVVSAIGQPEYIRGDMLKHGAVVIDVGTNMVYGKVCGDVHFESASKVAGLLTPVPGGVGPVTVSLLMQNVLKAQKLAYYG